MARSAQQWPLRSGHTPAFVLAHRGDTSAARENTVEAFAAALQVGADGVELDVRLTGDGVVVVHHDRDVPGAGPVDEQRADALPAWLPRLGEALSSCEGAFVDVEVKASPFEPGLRPGQELAESAADVVAGALDAARAPAAVLVTSFWPDAVAAVRARCPELVTGLLVHPALEAAPALEQAVELGCRALLPFHLQLTEELLAESHARQVAVVPWTVNGEEALRAAIALGVDGLVTDEPALATLLVRRAMPR